MNSINRNQPEENRKDLLGQEAIDKIQELVQQSSNCFFCTAEPNGRPRGVRPMNVREVDGQGNLWFLSASDSHHIAELALNPEVQLYFQGSRHSDFLHLVGKASISADRRRIERLWEPALKTWFTGGIDDPRITVIQVEPVDGYYWDTKHGNFVAGVKVMIGAALGVTLDDSLEGAIKVS